MTYCVIVVESEDSTSNGLVYISSDTRPFYEMILILVSVMISSYV